MPVSILTGSDAICNWLEWKEAVITDVTTKTRVITQVDQPLCLECATRVREEMDAAVVEMEAECEAYEAALQNLAQEDARPMSEEVRDGSARSPILELKLGTPSRPLSVCRCCMSALGRLPVDMDCSIVLQEMCIKVAMCLVPAQVTVS